MIVIDLVLDISSYEAGYNSSCFANYNIFQYVFEKGFIEIEYNEDDSIQTIKNKDGKTLAIIDSNPLEITIPEDVTEEDNIIIDLDDVREWLEEQGWLNEEYDAILSKYERGIIRFVPEKIEEPVEETPNNQSIIENPKTWNNILFVLGIPIIATIGLNRSRKKRRG